MCCDWYRDNTSAPVATSHCNDRLSDTFGVKLQIRELRLNGSRTLSKKKPKKAEIGAPCGITFSRVSTRCRVKAKDDARAARQPTTGCALNNSRAQRPVRHLCCSAQR